MPTTHAPDHRHELDLEHALDFLNTRDLDDGLLIEHLQAPADARDYFTEHGVVHAASRAWTAADLDRARRVRDAAREVVDAVVEGYAPRSAAVALVNGAVTAAAPVWLDVAGTEVRVGHRHGDDPVDEALAAVVGPILETLASGRPERLRVCANDRCRWTFYDASPTGRRRWCDMATCGNRAKAARHRQRVRAASEPRPL